MPEEKLPDETTTASGGFGRLYGSWSLATEDCASLTYVEVLVRRDFEASLPWPPKIPCLSLLLRHSGAVLNAGESLGLTSGWPGGRFA